MHFNKKYVKAIISVAVCIAVFFASGCSALSGFEKTEINSSINFQGNTSEFRFIEKGSLEKTASTDSTSLYIDKNSGAVTLSDKETSLSWNSVPYFANDFAAAFIVRILYGNKIIELDSSFNAAKNGNITYSEHDNGIDIVYEFVYESIKVKLPVSFVLQGAYLNVSVDLEKCEYDEDLKILSVSFLPYFGAVRYDSTGVDYGVFGDFFLVPDGAGALMYTAFDDDYSQKTYSVYGKQYYEDCIKADVGAYGIKQGNSALAVTLTDGVENALIRVVRSNADDRRINMIYPEFIVTPISEQTGKVLVGSSYSGKIGVCYDVLVNDSADYTGIAVSVRQALINSGILSGKTFENEYPFFVSVTGSFNGSKREQLTSFQQTEDLLNILKSKGINNINLILEGAFSSGVFSDASSKLRVDGTLGGNKDFDALCNYASAQNLNIFLGINYLTTDGLNSTGKALDGTAAERVAHNSFYPLFGDENFSFKYLDSAKFSDSVKNLSEFLRKYEFSGFCLLDTGEICAADNSEGGAYTNYNNALSSSLGAISSQTEIMLQGAAMNTIKNADYIKGVPLYTETEVSGFLISVPFLQIILHGTVIYTGDAANSFVVPRMHLLKCVEYGAVPYYSWVYNEKSDYYYENTLTEAVEFFVNAERELGDLSSKRITEHFMYESGVYCTGYEGGVRVYVNYNNYSVVIGEVSVMPYDYLRIG